MAKRKYLIVYERDRDGWWVAEVKELAGCHTQGRSIAQARERIREAMELHDVPADAKTEEMILMTPGLDDYVREVRELREEAERKAEESAEATKRAATKLAKAGISRRDAAEILGVSFQRVQQLVK